MALPTPPDAHLDAALQAWLRPLDAAVLQSADWIFAVYYAAIVCLSLYGVHRLHLLWGLWRTRGEARAPGAESVARPRVLVQLPLYNERSVAARLVDACARLEYPADRLTIQVLDDSTDQTSRTVAERVAHWQRRGVHIEHLRRPDRVGYKAGALAAGLRGADAELVAVFDADFEPDPDFLRRLVPHFEDPTVGMVQARWDYRNRGTSLLTRIQALLLDGHFLIEHRVRHARGCFFNFNGTAGIWRRRAIEEGGGWQHDTVTEDLDLSYRSQLAGWRFVYDDEVGVRSDLPDSLAAYRGQQRRWTRGSAQTLRKLGARLLRAAQPWRVRVEALAHLGANLGYLLTVLIALLLPPVVYARHLRAEPQLLRLDVALLLFGTMAVCLFYLVAARRRGTSLLAAACLLPALLALCMGLAWHNARACLSGLRTPGGEFERTPKGAYRPKRPVPWGESLLTLYLGCAVLAMISVRALVGLPFLILFAIGFGSAASTLWRHRRRHSVPRPEPTATPVQAPADR